MAFVTKHLKLTCACIRGPLCPHEIGAPLHVAPADSTLSSMQHCGFFLLNMASFVALLLIASGASCKAQGSAFSAGATA